MRIWFNRGFSLAPIAKALMAADPDLAVYISTGEGKPQYDGAAGTWVEPDLPDTEYLAWVEAQIRDHQIDIFIPTHRRELFVDAWLPCRVHLPATAAVLAILEDKCAFAKEITGWEFHAPTWQAHTPAEMREVFNTIKSANPDGIVCIKPLIGVNGHGFWKLEADSPTDHLMRPEFRNIDPEMFFAAIDAEERSESGMRPLAVMEYLPGPEISFDVLALRGRILRYIARTKSSGSQRLQSKHPLDEAVRSLVRHFDLTGVINVQFRRATDGSWKALEINARPAGGSVYAEQFGGKLLADWGGLLTRRITPSQVDQTPIDIEIAFTSKLELAA